MAKVMKSTDSSSLAEVVDRILDKGIVIDAWVKVSLVGIELLSIEARIVVASVETYLGNEAKLQLATGRTAASRPGRHRPSTARWRRNARATVPSHGRSANTSSTRSSSA